MSVDNTLFYQPRMTEKQAMLVAGCMAYLFADEGPTKDALETRASEMLASFNEQEITDFLSILSVMSTDIVRRQKEVHDA